MLHIIAMILKCIGILAVLILCALLFVLVTILFVPVRYEADAEFPGKAEEISANVKVTWLFHLIRADVKWKKQKLEWKIRVAWKIFEEKEKRKDVEKTAEKSVEKPEGKESENEVEKRMDSPNKVEKNIGQPEKDVTETKNVKNKASKTVNVKTVNKKTEVQKSLWEKIKNKIQSIWERIKCTFQKICDKIKTGIDLKEKIMDFLTDEVHKAAYMRIKKEFIWLRRFFKVTKGHIKLKFGFEDPSITGGILAILSTLYPLFEGNLYVEPDFEEQCLEGSIYLKGRLRIIHPAILAVKLIIDRNIRQTYKDINALKNS